MISSLYIDCADVDILQGFNISGLRDTILGVLFCKIDNLVMVNILINNFNDSDIGEWMKMTGFESRIERSCNISFTIDYPDFVNENFQGHLRDVGIQYENSLGCSEVYNHDMFNGHGAVLRTETGSLAIFGVLVGFMCAGVAFVWLLSKAWSASSCDEFNTGTAVIRSIYYLTCNHDIIG